MHNFIAMLTIQIRMTYLTFLIHRYSQSEITFFIFRLFSAIVNSCIFYYSIIFCAILVFYLHWLQQQFISYQSCHTVVFFGFQLRFCHHRLFLVMFNTVTWLCDSGRFKRIFWPLIRPLARWLRKFLKLTQRKSIKTFCSFDWVNLRYCIVVGHFYRWAKPKRRNDQIYVAHLFLIEIRFLVLKQSYFFYFTSVIIFYSYQLFSQL